MAGPVLICCNYIIWEGPFWPDHFPEPCDAPGLNLYVFKSKISESLGIIFQYYRNIAIEARILLNFEASLVRT